ncbi:MAG: trans-aconitate 2-methyltransferase, partial [Pyrinomonadaceae bacterium]
DGQQSATRYVDFIRAVIANRSRKQLINKVSDEMSWLGMRATDDSLLRGIASEVALLVPAQKFVTTTTVLQTGRTADEPGAVSDAHVTGNGDAGAPPSRDVERVPYHVDHETSLQCRFLKHDVESAPLPQKFDALICYDALHHFGDESAVFSHLAAMLNIGGSLFILEGQKPDAGSATEDELC